VFGKADSAPPPCICALSVVRGYESGWMIANSRRHCRLWPQALAPARLPPPLSLLRPPPLQPLHVQAGSHLASN